MTSPTTPSATTLHPWGVERDLGHTHERVAWADLVAVSILTTDEGPWCEDFYWLLQAKDGTGCAVPMADAQQIGLLPRLQQLPGFDNEAVIQASLTTTERARFECWEGQPGEAVGGSL